MNRTNDQWPTMRQYKYCPKLSVLRAKSNKPTKIMFAYAVLQLLDQADMIRMARPTNFDILEDEAESTRGWEFYWNGTTTNGIYSDRESLQPPTHDTERASHE